MRVRKDPVSLPPSDGTLNDKLPDQDPIYRWPWVSPSRQQPPGQAGDSRQAGGSGVTHGFAGAPGARLRTLPCEAMKRSQSRYVSRRGGVCRARNLDTGGQDA